jgi:phage gp16-like protein
MATKMIAKIHVLKKQLCLTEESYRDILRNNTGYESAKGLSKDQLSKVIEYMNAQLNAKPDPVSKAHLMEKIADTLRAQGKHGNYAREILSRITNKSLIQCGVYELEKTLEQINAQGQREAA